MKMTLDSTRITLILALLLIGCEGDPGRPGISRLPDDLHPPSAEIILPIASRPLYDRSIIEVLVTDDDSVARTAFLVDGLPPVAGTITLFNPPTQYLWDCSALSFGQHSLQLIAWDMQDKIGQSAMLYLNRTEQIPDELDTLRLFDDDSTKSMRWKLPTDSLGTFRGLATRFTPDGPVRVLNVRLRLFKKLEWSGENLLFLDLMSVRNGLPDTVTVRDSLSLPPRGEEKDYDGWVRYSFGGISVPGEFFVVVRLPDDFRGDTLAVHTDDGLWKNGHGLVLTSDGEWRPFTTGSGRHYNPLIYATVRYQ